MAEALGLFLPVEHMLGRVAVGSHHHHGVAVGVVLVARDEDLHPSLNNIEKSAIFAA